MFLKASNGVVSAQKILLYINCKLVCRLSTSLCSKVDILLFFKGQTILKAQ